MTDKKKYFSLFAGLALIITIVVLSNISQAQTESMSDQDKEFYKEGINPAESDVEDGKALFNAKVGETACADCHGTGGKGGDLKGAAATFPKFHKGPAKVVSLQLMVNYCRVNAQKAEKFAHKKGKMASIVTYIKSLSNGMPVNIQLKTPEEKTAYKLGERVYSQRRGERNLGCIVCHKYVAGSTLRMQKLTPIGDGSSHWPAYRMTKGKLYMIELRFQQCMKNARMAKLKLGSDAMVGLELYVTKMANDTNIQVPGWVR